MTWRHICLFFVVLLLVLAVVFELSLMYPPGEPFNWVRWVVA